MLTFILLFTFIGVPLIFLFAKRTDSPGDGWMPQDAPYTGPRDDGGCAPAPVEEGCGPDADSGSDSGSECGSDSGGSSSD